MDDALHSPHHIPHDVNHVDQDMLLSVYCALALLLVGLVPRLLPPTCSFFPWRQTAHQPQPPQESLSASQSTAQHSSPQNSQHTSQAQPETFYDTAPMTNVPSALPRPLPAFESPHTAFIESEEKFYQSPELQRHLRHRASGHIDRVRHRLRLYQKLRRADPSGFQKLWDDPHLKRHETICLPTWLVLLEYVAPVMLTWTSCLIYGYGGIYGAAALAWALLQLYAAYQGNTSSVGMLFGVYGVQSDPDFLVGSWRVVVAHLLEVGYVRATFGVGAIVSATLRCSTKNGQSFGELCCQVYPVREILVPVKCSKYWSGSRSR